MNSVEYAGEYQASVNGVAHARLDGEDPEVEKEDRGFRKAHCWGLENVLGKYELPLLSTFGSRG